jgi:transposase
MGAKDVGAVKGSHDSEEPIMQAVTTIGLDIAKSVFQVHGIDAEGRALIRRRLKRRYVVAFFQKLPPCLVGIEACAMSHHWSRELRAWARHSAEKRCNFRERWSQFSAHRL